jgi:hypothetical protein
MKPRAAQLCLLLLACLCLPALAWSDAGYLATVGPAHLRFYTTPPVVKTAPAPFTNTDTNQNSGAAPVQPRPANPFDIFNPSVDLNYSASSVTTPQPEPQPAAEPAIPTSAPQPTDVVSPQMLLQYFGKNGTNPPAAGVIAPLNLGNPASTPSPSSKATYSN